jgi:protease secretion system membrane fusion protein
MADFPKHNVRSSELKALSDLDGIRSKVRIVAGVCFFGFFLWAALIPLDEGVPTQGSVVIETRRIPVQHLYPGTLEKVYVREGQLVAEGDLLIRLSDTAARTEYETARQILLSLKSQEDSRRSEMLLLEKELRGISELVRNQFVPQQREQDLNRQIMQMRSSIDDLVSQQAYTKERLSAARETLNRTEIRASVAGQIIGLKVQSPGVVINGGDVLAELVPKAEQLILETRISPQLIDRIKIGDLVDIRFSAFSHSPQLVVEGILKTISEDVLTDASSKTNYYLAQIALTPDGLRGLGTRKMQPGMPVEVIIKTGSRTLLTYIADPLIKRLSMSLKEE